MSKKHTGSASILRDPDCTRCKVHEIATEVCVLGKGPKRCDVMVVDETPRDESDRSRRLLRKLLEEASITDVYITSALSCATEVGRKPKKGELVACRHWLDEEMARVRPKFVLLLGSAALMGALGLTGIQKIRGRPIEQDGRLYFPIYHPAMTFRTAKAKGVIQADLRFFAECIKQGGIPETKGLNHTIVKTKKQFRRMLRSLHGTVSFDIETTGLYPWAPRAKVVSIGFGTRGKQWCIPFNHRLSPWEPKQLAWMVRELDPIIHSCNLVAQFGKFDCTWMRVHYGVDWKLEFDTGLAHHLLDENSFHNLDYLASKFYGAVSYDVPLEIKTGQTGTLEEHCKYLAGDLFYTRKLRFTLAKLLQEDWAIDRLYRVITMPCNSMYTDIEYNGFYVNKEQFDQAEKHLEKKIAESIAKLDKIAAESWYPEKVNWGSTQQVAKFMFEHLKLPVVSCSDSTGAPSTSKAVMIRTDHPVTDAILEFRGAKQQKSFFIEGWKPYLTPEGYIHPHFKLHGTVTGRPSCENPNLQQVPKDPFIRSLISAPPGWQLVECDLSQAEMRIAAELSKDPVLTELFRDGRDSHWITAISEIRRGGAYPKKVISTVEHFTGQKLRYGDAIEELLKLDPGECAKYDKFWKTVRDNAKPVNFGYLFGMWWKKFKDYALDKYGVRLTDKQSEESREAFFALYKGLPPWHERQRRYARRHGYVRSLSGRKRRLPAAQQMHKSFERDEALRQAINAPVQGFAQEINLMAAIQLYREYDSSVVRIVGTVHDSVLFMVRDDQVAPVVSRMLKIMEKPDILDELGVKLTVPMKADASIGPWSKGVSLEQWRNTKRRTAKSKRTFDAKRSFTTSTRKGSSKRRSHDRTNSEKLSTRVSKRARGNGARSSKRST